MMRMTYAGGEVLTGHAIAQAVIDYAAALAEADMATTIEIPGRTAEGVTGTFGILLGPSSQILVEPTDDAEEIEDPELLDELRRLTRVLTDPPPIAPAEAGDLEWNSDFD